MAAPHVTGAIALLFERAGRGLSIEETRRLILASCDPPPEGADVARIGSGYLNVSRALALVDEVAAPTEKEVEVNTSKAADMVDGDPGITDLLDTPDSENATGDTELGADDDARADAGTDETEDVRPDDVFIDLVDRQTDADEEIESEPYGAEAYDELIESEGEGSSVGIGESMGLRALSLPIMQVSTEATGPCPDVAVPPASRPAVLVRGSVHPAVREAQRKLNAFHALRVMAGASGLRDAPLAEDCIFGRHTFAATLSFQELAFPGMPIEHDGKIGPHTWDQLDAIAVGPGGIAVVTVDAIRVTDDTFGAPIGWDSVVGLDTTALNLELTASGLPPATMPSQIPVGIVSRPPNRAAGRATLGTAVAVDVPLHGPHASIPNRIVYRLARGLAALGPFEAVERQLKEMTTIARFGGTSDAIFRTALGWESRGVGTQPTVIGTSTGNEPTEVPDAFTLLRAAGAEVIEVAVVPQPNWRLPAPARRLGRSPADVVYYSGHGSSRTGHLLIDTGPTPQRCPSPGPFPSWLAATDLTPVWRSPMDLDILILAGCSVLKIDFSTSPPSGPGLAWSNLLTTKGGPLAALLGYQAGAPCDSPIGDRIARDMGARMAGGSTRFARDWLEVNGRNNADNAVAMDASGYWSIDSGLFGGFDIEGPRAIP